jgi:hypothetical protein
MSTSFYADESVMKYLANNPPLEQEFCQTYFKRKDDTNKANVGKMRRLAADNTDRKRTVEFDLSGFIRSLVGEIRTLVGVNRRGSVRFNQQTVVVASGILLMLLMTGQLICARGTFVFVPEQPSQSAVTFSSATTNNFSATPAANEMEN